MSTASLESPSGSFYYPVTEPPTLTTILDDCLVSYASLERIENDITSFVKGQKYDVITVDNLINNNKGNPIINGRSPNAINQELFEIATIFNGNVEVINKLLEGKCDKDGRMHIIDTDGELMQIKIMGFQFDFLSRKIHKVAQIFDRTMKISTKEVELNKLNFAPGHSSYTIPTLQDKFFLEDIDLTKHRVPSGENPKKSTSPITTANSTTTLPASLSTTGPQNSEKSTSPITTANSTTTLPASLSTTGPQNSEPKTPDVVKEVISSEKSNEPSQNEVAYIRSNDFFISKTLPSDQILGACFAPNWVKEPVVFNRTEDGGWICQLPTGAVGKFVILNANGQVIQWKRGIIIHLMRIPHSVSK